MFDLRLTFFPGDPAFDALSEMPDAGTRNRFATSAVQTVALYHRLAAKVPIPVPAPRSHSPAKLRAGHRIEVRIYIHSGDLAFDVLNKLPGSQQRRRYAASSINSIAFLQGHGNSAEAAVAEFGLLHSGSTAAISIDTNQTSTSPTSTASPATDAVTDSVQVPSMAALLRDEDLGPPPTW